MSKAFLCDNCGEFSSGEPELKIHGFDICYTCVRVAKALRNFDPFKFNMVGNVKMEKDKLIHEMK